MSLNNYHSTASHQDFYFRQIDHNTALPCDGASTEAVLVLGDSFDNVNQLKDAIGVKCGDSSIRGIDSSLQTVYEYKASCYKSEETERNAEPLKAASALAVLHESPDETSMSGSAYCKLRASVSAQCTVIQKVPNSNRVERWKKLNEVLKGQDGRSRNDFTSSSALKWRHVKGIFETSPFVFPQRHIDDHNFDFLEKYLACTRKYLRYDTHGGNAEGLHMIAAVLICVANSFDDAEIDVEKDLEGKFLRAVCHLDFVLRRRNRAICVVQAKMGRIENGMAKVLVGCEIAAEVGNFDCVYGVVTDCVKWIFLLSHDEKISEDVLSSPFHAGEATNRMCLRQLVETMHAVLSNE